MRLVKIGMASIDTKVGDFARNTERVIRAAREIAAAGAHLGCFQELTFLGYSPEDLVQWPGAIERQLRCLDDFLEATKSDATVFTLGIVFPIGDKLYNCAAVVAAGRVLAVVPKEKLPTYGVFYEWRIFQPGLPGLAAPADKVRYPDAVFGDVLVETAFGLLSVEVCEDLWTPDGPLRRRCFRGAAIAVNLSASPWRLGVADTRTEMIKTRSGDNLCALVYVNQYGGGNDSLTYDGGQYVAVNGRLVHEGRRWREAVTFAAVDLDQVSRARERNTTWRRDANEWLDVHPDAGASIVGGSHVGQSSVAKSVAGLRYPTPVSKSFFLPAADGQPQISPRDRMLEELQEALVTGLGGYLEKVGFQKVGIALSGGRDSALVLILTWIYANRRFGSLEGEAKSAAIRDFIHCFSFPSKHNSAVTRGGAAQLAADLGVTFAEIDIKDEMETVMAAQREMCAASGVEVDMNLAYQNAQARIRGNRMGTWTNSTRGVSLMCSNMSEAAAGYGTTGGDWGGAHGYAPIKNVPKTVVNALLDKLLDEWHWPGLHRILTVKASAELKDDQEDERDLMPFEVLDFLMYLLAEERMGPPELLDALRVNWTDGEFRVMCPSYDPAQTPGQWVDKFVRLFWQNVFKWESAPLGTHVGSLDLSRTDALRCPVVSARGGMEPIGK